MASALQSRPDIFRQRVSFQECRDTLQPYLRRTGKKLPHKDRMHITLQLSFCEAVVGNITESESLLTECEEYILRRGTEEEKACAYHIRCRLYLHHSESERAVAAGIQSLYIFKQLDLPYFTMTTAICTGIACSTLNLYTEAIDYLTMARTKALEMGDNKEALLCTANLNEIRILVLPARECIDYNLQMLADIYKEYGTKPSTAEAAACLHLAHLYIKTKNMVAAAVYADRGLAVVAQFSYLSPSHFLYTNLYALKAEIAAEQGDEVGMMRYAEECLHRARAVHKTSPEIDVLFILFRYYLSRDSVRAKGYLDQAGALIPDTDKTTTYLDLNENKCAYYHAIGDSRAELDHFKLIHEYKITTQREALDSRSKMQAVIYELELQKKQMEQQKAELNYKTQELNMTNYYLQQRDQLLAELKNDISGLKKSKPKADTIFKTISKTIDVASAQEESDRTRFKEKFNEAHRAFIARLHQAYPALSPAECRVAALLRSGFNTKDISRLLNTSIRSIENHRLSIRKKMTLTREDNLNLMLTTIE